MIKTAIRPIATSGMTCTREEGERITRELEVWIKRMSKTEAEDDHSERRARQRRQVDELSDLLLIV